MNTKEFVRPNIGFIGMGHMGSHIALRLLASGYSLTVYDRTMEKTQPAVSHGAHVAATPRTVAEQSDVIMSSVTDDVALQAVMFGPEGILAGARPGTIAIEMSTVSPTASPHVYEAAKEHGLQMIDADVLGSVPQQERRICFRTPIQTGSVPASLQPHFMTFL